MAVSLMNVECERMKEEIIEFQSVPKQCSADKQTHNLTLLTRRQMQTMAIRKRISKTEALKQHPQRYLQVIT